MATIYAVPSDIKKPNLSFRNVSDMIADEERYINEVRTFVKNYHPDGGEHIGKLIDFPVADSQAVYMVASMKPLQLVHLEVGDAWQYQYANRLKAKDVLQKIQQKESLARFFEEQKAKKQ